MASSIARTSAFPNSTTLRGIHMVAFHHWTQRDPVGRGLFNVYESDQSKEHTLTMGGAGLFDNKAEGAALDYTSLNEGFLQTYTYEDFSKGFRVTRRQYINDLYQSMDKHAAELGRMAYATEETQLAKVFNDGFSGVVTTPDGNSVFNTAHTREDGGVIQNRLSSDADLSRTSLEQVLINFRDFRDGGGKRLQIKPTTLLTAADNVFNAWTILGSSHQPENDSNAINPVNSLGLSHVVWDYLTDADAWFVLSDKSDHMLQLYNREEFWTEHIYDFDTKDIKFSGMFGQSSGVGDPRGIYGTDGA
jgi:hypothetical protein